MIAPDLPRRSVEGHPDWLPGLQGIVLANGQFVKCWKEHGEITVLPFQTATEGAQGSAAEGALRSKYIKTGFCGQIGRTRSIPPRWIVASNFLKETQVSSGRQNCGSSSRAYRITNQDKRGAHQPARQ